MFKKFMTNAPGAGERMKELQNMLETRREEIGLLHAEISSITALLLLAGTCDHSKTEQYMWEHDTGYGVQRMIEGKRCSYCGCVDLWNRRAFIDPSEIR